MRLLEIAVLAAALWAVGGLVFLHRKAKGYGQRQLHSKPAGTASQGIWYAFTKGMSPWAKESVRENMASYGAGMAFHGGVFAALALLVASLLGVGMPYALLLALRGVLIVGLLGALALLGKRLALPWMRGLSCPDDYVSNLLSGGFILLALLSSFFPALRTAWLVETTVLLLYVPLGKIRHCFFFFTTRRHLGAFFGHRGVFPPTGGLHG